MFKTTLLIACAALLACRSAGVPPASDGRPSRQLEGDRAGRPIGAGETPALRPDEFDAPVAQSGSHEGQYVCPMHPEVIGDKPGTCPKCGMALVEKK